MSRVEKAKNDKLDVSLPWTEVQPRAAQRRRPGIAIDGQNRNANDYGIMIVMYRTFILEMSLMITKS